MGARARAPCPSVRDPLYLIDLMPVSHGGITVPALARDPPYLIDLMHLFMGRRLGRLHILRARTAAAIGCATRHGHELQTAQEV